MKKILCIRSVVSGKCHFLASVLKQASVTTDRCIDMPTFACECGYTSSASKRNVLRHQVSCHIRRDMQIKELMLENQRLKGLVGDDKVTDKTASTQPANKDEPAHKRQKTEKRIAIYVIVHKLTLKIVYVGKTCDVARRFKQHASYTSQCRLLREAFLKEGRHNFEIKPLMFCSESDADKNESTMIAKLNTIHPNGLNLRCGSRAGVEETDASLTTIDDSCTDVVAFENISDESDATAQGWADVAQMLKDGDDGEDVDIVCKKWLKKIHPDVSKQETFSAAEVAAIVNDIRKTQK